MKQQASSASLLKIDHINIVVQDLPAAKKFFLDLGFEVIREDTLTGSWIDTITNLKNVKAEYCALRLGEGQTNLELIRYDSPDDTTNVGKQFPNQAGFRHMAFEVDNIEEIVENLKSKGVTLFSEIQSFAVTKKKLCYFYGPEGIILELAEYKN